jgi:hypothetical protein
MPAFDAISTMAGNGTGNFSFTHTPVSTAPKGVLFIAAQDVGVTEEITSVTYGGIALTHVALSPLVKDAGTEDGVIYGYFLGSSVPTGAQTVAVVVSTPIISSKRGIAVTLTSTASTVEVGDTTTLNSASVTNPSVVVDTTATSFVIGCLFSGQNAITSVTESTDYTLLASEHDFGGTVASWQCRTNNSTSTGTTVNWTAGSEKAGILAIAIRDVVSAVTNAASLVNSQFLKSKLRGLVG